MRPSRKKKVFFLDFSAPEIDREEAFARSRAATTLTKATLLKAARASSVLPEDLHFSSALLSRLFMRPQRPLAMVGAIHLNAFSLLLGWLANELFFPASSRCRYEICAGRRSAESERGR